MTEQEIKEYITAQFPKENESVEWKNFSNLQNTLCGHPGDDVISYVSAIANMNGGSLVIGVEDQTLQVAGIQKFGNYTLESAKFRICEKCQNLPSENLEIMELKSADTSKTVWIINMNQKYTVKGQDRIMSQSDTGKDTANPASVCINPYVFVFS